MPDVSVVIPAFNAAPYIAEAIESARRQESIGQVIVVDDGSSDGTGDIAAAAGTTVIRRANGGIGAARNSALPLAKGEFLAFLDADDVWPPGRTRALLAALEAAPGIDAAFGQVVEFGEGRADGEPQAARLAGAMLIRRSAFDRVGPFREDLKVGEFVDWWARAEEASVRSVSIPDVVLRRRIHTSNTGIREADSRVDYARVLRAALHRRRGAS